MFFKKNLIFIIIFFILSITSSINKSATYDEIQHLPCGYAYWKTKDFGYGMEHPPFLRLWSSIPLIFKKWKTPDFSIIKERDRTSLSKWDFHPDYEFGYKFLYENNADLILFLGRFFISLLIIPFAFVFFNWAKNLYGEKQAYLGLILLCFSPNLIAHSHLVTTDFGVTVFIFISSYFLLKFFKEPNLKNSILSGFFCSLSLSSKFTAVFYFFVFLITGFFVFGIKRKIKYILLKIFLIWFLINLFYFFKEPIFKHIFLRKELEIFFPHFISGFIQKILYWVPLPDMYLRSFVFSFLHSQSSGISYFLGKLSNKGFWYFYPLSFLLKTPVTTIIFLILAKLSLKKKFFNKDEIYYIIPNIVFIIFLLRSKLNLGLRHLLPVYPFIFLFISRLKWKKYFSYLIIFYLFSVLRVYPNFLSYFNIFVSKYKTWFYTVDSNLDWGQDLKKLSIFLKKKGNPPIYLSYFGTSSPDYYKINYIDLYSTSYVRHLWKEKEIKEKPEFLALSLTNLAGMYYGGKDIFKVFKKVKPDFVIGRSIFLYDLKRFKVFIDKK